MARKYKGVSQWHRERDARWYEMHKNGVPVHTIAQQEHYNPDTVSARIRHHESLLNAQDGS